MSQEAYLRQHYGITLAERDAIAVLQGNKCACCGRPFDKDCRVEVDHEHFKVVAKRDSGPTYVGWRPEDGQKGWVAVASLTHTVLFWRWAKTKEAAIKLAKKDGLRHSVRGLLCGGRHAGCNRRLGRVDKPDWLRSVLVYLENPPARQILG